MNSKNNNLKQSNIAIEKRLRAVATWECTRGNRQKTNTDEIFECAKGFRSMLEHGMFVSLDEMEETVFGHWGLDQPVGFAMEFLDEDPVGGG